MGLRQHQLRQTTETKPLKVEHVNEIKARMLLIEQYQKRLMEVQGQVKLTGYTWSSLKEAWETCVVRGFGREEPWDLEERAVLVNEYWQEHQALQKLERKLSVTVEALHEGLTLWLASRYDFDAHEKQPWQLDLDNGLLYRTVLREAEKEG